MKKNHGASVKIPSSVYKACPHCRSSSLSTYFNGQVKCECCRWDSLAVYEECVSRAAGFPYFCDDRPLRA